MLPRYHDVRCGDCGQGLTWIEIAFGRFLDPVCGPCLLSRQTADELPSESRSAGWLPDEPPEFDVKGGL